MIVYNQGNDPILDASLSLILPNHNSFYIAESLPRKSVRGGFADRTPDEIAAYPSVSLRDGLCPHYAEDRRHSRR